MNIAEFLPKYAKCKTWADLDELIDQLAYHNQSELREALQTVKTFTGLDMRQEFLLGILRGKLRYSPPPK